ncbi:MAG TPA: TetR family transcriptional regulator [Bacillota bacterium]|nr:TetR family transcriptional regulator [Bacillota bacterium]
MPKQTFFNLPDQKQAVLLQAAMNEFSRVPLHDASIANIIHEANVARGSFYQYFKDKEDVFYYLLETHAKQSQESLLLYLRKYDYDLFKAIPNMFTWMLEKFHERTNRDFFKQAFLHMNVKVEQTFSFRLRKEELQREYKRLIKGIDKTPLNYDTLEELHHIIELVFSITMHNVVHSFARDLTIEQANHRFNMQLSLLKRGIFKREHV